MVVAIAIVLLLLLATRSKKEPTFGWFKSEQLLISFHSNYYGKRFRLLHQNGTLGKRNERKRRPSWRERSSTFSVFWDLKLKTPFLTNPPHWIRASERYLTDKNPIHGRETAWIFLFSAETFESDLNMMTVEGMLLVTPSTSITVELSRYVKIIS